MPTDYVQLKNINGTALKPVTDLAAINMTTTNGIAVEAANGGTIGIRAGYIESCYYTEMIEPTTAANPESGFVSGGTMYTLLGGYAITSDVPPATAASEYRVPSEKAVREAIDAYVATGGSDIVAGKGIDMGGGQINATEATVEETLKGYTVSGGTVEPYNDQVVMPYDLRGALSVGQAVDVSCDPGSNVGTVTFEDNDFLKTITWSGVAQVTTYFGFGSISGTWYHLFPKYAAGLSYLYIFDIVMDRDCKFTIYASDTTKAIGDWVGDVTANTKVRVAAVTTATGFVLRLRGLTTGTQFTATITNSRQYEVTSLTDEAIAYLATLENPDDFFRSTDVYTIRNKYLIKQDMVCPFIPTIEMSNSDLTVAAGLSYKMTCVSSTPTTREITADTIPTLAYGWDTHLQLFVDDKTTVNFKYPLVLEDPLTPNAGHNMTIKWRNGQALAYVDDRDIGYIVTVTAGTENGSLYYGLINDVGEYITFANTTDGTPIEVDGATVTRELNILGNGVGSTEINGSYIYSKYGNGGKLSVRGISTNASIITYKGTLSLYNCSITNAHYTKGINNDTQDTVVGGGAGINIVGSTLSGLYRDSEAAGGTKGWGTISAYSQNQNNIENSTIQGLHDSRLGIFGANISLKNTRFIDNSYLKVSNSDHFISITANDGTGQNYITDCYISGTTNTRSTAMPVFVGIDGAVNCTISGSTFATSGDNIEVYASGGTVTFSGTNILNSTVSGAGNIVFADGSTITSTGDGSAEHPRGVIRPGRPTYVPGSAAITIENVDIVGFTQTERYSGIFNINYGSNVLTLKNVTFKNITDSGVAQGGAGVITGSYDRLNTTIDLVGCTVTGVTNALFAPLLVGGTNCYFGFKDCDIANPVSTASYVASIEVIRSLNTRVVVDNTCIHGRLTLYGNKSGTVVDLNGSTHGRAIIRDNDSSAVRVFSNTTLTFTTAESQITRGTETVAIGSYNSANTVYTVGGSASVITPGGQTVSLTGIGTYIYADGSNDFSTPYTVSTTAASGSGSLLNGLVGSTKYMVVAHNITDTSAVLSNDISGRVVNICCGDGRTIVGGTVSIQTGATVSVHTTQDASGASQVTGSTVTISGGSTTLSGNCIVGGVISPTSGLSLLNGTTVSGAGAGASITGMTITQNIDVTSRTVTLQNLTINSPRNVTTSNTQSSGAIYTGGTWLIKNCKILNVQSRMTTGFVFGHCNVVIEGSTCTGEPFVYIQRSDKSITLRNSTVTSAITYSDASVRIEGNCTILSRVGKINDAEGNDRLILADGATVNIASAARNDPMASNAIVCEGTATIVYAGGTKKVKDTGTYFNKDGSTNLTVVS